MTRLQEMVRTAEEKVQQQQHLALTARIEIDKMQQEVYDGHRNL